MKSVFLFATIPLLFDQLVMRLGNSPLCTLRCRDFTPGCDGMQYQPMRSNFLQ